MKTSLITVIEGYGVEVEPGTMMDPSQCWVTYKKFHASLACLQDTGVLTDHSDREHVVPAWIVCKIEEWALAHGY